MSVDACKRCGRYVDTDFHVEFYREEYDYEGLCDNCFEGRLKDEPRVFCPKCNKWTDAIDDGETCGVCKLVC